MDVKSLAKKYYPKFWSDERLCYLVSIGRLTKEDYEEITGKNYTE